MSAANILDALYQSKALGGHIINPPSATGGTIALNGNDMAEVRGNTNSNETWKLPVETSTPKGIIVFVSNAGTGNLTITNTAGTTIDTVDGDTEIKGFILSAGEDWKSLGGVSATALGGVTSTTGATLVGYEDSGTHTTATTVAGALDDIYTSLVAVEKIDVPLTSVVLEDGTALTKQATTAIGFEQLSNKNMVITFPASAATAKLAFTVNLPNHARKDTNIRLKVVVSKSANTDTLTMDAELYLLDGVTMAWSADGGGAAVSIPSAAAVTLTYTVANPSTLTDNPDALAVVLELVGAHTTDAVYIHNIYVQYTGAVV